MTPIIGPHAVRANVCGLHLDHVTLQQAVDRVVELVEHGRAHRTVHQVVTINVDFVVTAEEQHDVRDILLDASLALADGMPLVWASRLLGTPLPQRVTGADLVPALARRCATAGYRLALFGGADGVATTAAARLRHRSPDLDVRPLAAPALQDVAATDPGVVEQLQELEADVLCVALGHPKQERWIAHWGREVGIPVAIGVGGTLDFLAGVQRRAPVWMRNSGTEWLYRAMRDPRRLGQRYARDLVRFPPHVLTDLRSNRARRRQPLPDLHRRS